MADEPLPLIAEKDYPAFLRLIKRDFPDAYEEWPDTYEKWHETHEQEAKKRRLLGHTVRDVPVSPDEFAEFCRYNNHKGTLYDLLRCAFDIAAKVDEVARANIEYHED